MTVFISWWTWTRTTCIADTIVWILTVIVERRKLKLIFGVCTNNWILWSSSYLENITMPIRTSITRSSCIWFLIYPTTTFLLILHFIFTVVFIEELLDCVLNYIIINIDIFVLLFYLALINYLITRLAFQIVSVEGTDVEDYFTTIISGLLLFLFLTMYVHLILLVFHFMHYLHTFMDTQLLCTRHPRGVQTALIISCSRSFTFHHTTRWYIESTHYFLLTVLWTEIVIIRFWWWLEWIESIHTLLLNFKYFGFFTLLVLI